MSRDTGVAATPPLSHPSGAEPVPVSGKAGIANAGHTPWDWTGTPQTNGGAFHCYIVDCTGRKIGTVWGPGEEKIARAQLWSAAPELLAALEFVASDPCFSALGSVTRDEVQAAISKARTTVEAGQ